MQALKGALLPFRALEDRCRAARPTAAALRALGSLRESVLLRRSPRPRTRAQTENLSECVCGSLSLLVIVVFRCLSRFVSFCFVFNANVM